MLAKSVCILINTLAVMRAIRPPPAAAEDMTAAEKQKNRDKFKDMTEDRAVETCLTRPTAGLWGVAVEVLPYLWAMRRGTVDPRLDVWHVCMCLIGTLACLLRIWSFKALGRFFTYIVKIVPGHRLIKAGPYRYLVHPSYTGVFLCMLAFQGALFDQHWAWIQALVPLVNLPWWSGAMLFSWLLSRIFTTRARNEEIVLAAHFGAEWDEYVKERWRFVPFVY